MKKDIEQSPVQTVIGTLRGASMQATGHSWTRLNGVLRQAMHGLITAGVKFEADDVAKALGKSGSYWSDCEGWYSSACGSEHRDGGGNISAAISIENHLGRTPFMWAERTKSAERLRIGSEFTWAGERVKVTSFDDAAKTLTACSYKNEGDDEEEVGQLFYIMGQYRKLEARTDYNDGSIVARFSGKVDYESKKIKKRFCISNEEMQRVRADYDARRRKHEKAIKSAKTLEELESAKEAAAAEGQSAYRHFDLEILSAAIRTRREGIINGMPTEEEAKKALKKEKAREKERNEAMLAEWIAGSSDARPYFTGIIRLRIKGEFVECSNGNKVSLQSALKTLPLVHRCREKGWERNGQVHDIDAFRLERIDQRGVQIGCTLISWEEVDRFTPILKAARKAAKP